MVRRSSSTSRGTTYWFRFYFVFPGYFVCASAGFRPVVHNKLDPRVYAAFPLRAESHNITELLSCVHVGLIKKCRLQFEALIIMLMYFIIHALRGVIIVAYSSNFESSKTTQRTPNRYMKGTKLANLYNWSSARTERNRRLISRAFQNDRSTTNVTLILLITKVPSPRSSHNNSLLCFEYPRVKKGLVIFNIFHEEVTFSLLCSCNLPRCKTAFLIGFEVKFGASLLRKPPEQYGGRTGLNFSFQCRCSRFSSFSRKIMLWRYDKSLS